MFASMWLKVEASGSRTADSETSWERKRKQKKGIFFLGALLGLAELGLIDSQSLVPKGPSGPVLVR